MNKFLLAIIILFTTYNYTFAYQYQISDIESLIDRTIGDVKSKITSTSHHIITSKTKKLKITALHTSGHRFNAHVQVGDNRYTFYGKYGKKVRIPALKTSINRGYIITKDRITYIDNIQDDIRSGTILNTKNLVNMTAKHTILAYKPIMTYEITPQIMIKRNDIVNIKYKLGSIALQMNAIALQNGVKNQKIRLRNMRSGAIITGIVTSPNNVTLAGH